MTCTETARIHTSTIRRKLVLVVSYRSCTRERTWSLGSAGPRMLTCWWTDDVKVFVVDVDCRRILCSSGRWRPSSPDSSSAVAYLYASCHLHHTVRIQRLLAIPSNLESKSDLSPPTPIGLFSCSRKESFVKGLDCVVNIRGGESLYAEPGNSFPISQV